MTMLGKKHNEETKAKMRATALRKGTRPICDPIKISQALKGKKKSPEHRIAMSIARKGEKSQWWRGGVAKKNKIIRESVEYALWREAVYKRDDYTCILCKTRGGKLQPDHIKPFAYFPNLRFSLDNGRTLCVDCHKKTPTWGIGSRKLYETNRKSL